MPQFLINQQSIVNKTASLIGQDAKHICNVLRLKKDDWLILTNGQGKRWRAKILLSTPAKVTVEIIETLRAYVPKIQITLAQALLKHDRFEWIIQKAIELGCSRIVPFTNERTIPKFAAGKLERWQKIADTAAKQCGAVIHPKILSPLNFTQLIDMAQTTQTVLFWEGERAQDITSLKLQEKDTTIIIGPEGGFANDEIELVKERKILTCSLGPLILRVETAALAALSIVQNKLGHFSSTPSE